MNVRDRICFFFFFQAEDGIRDIGVTGVQTCALPISLASARLEVPDVVEDDGYERGGAFAPARPRDVDLADAAHAVAVEVGPDGVSRFPPASELGQLVQEALVLDVLQEGHHLWMRADDVRDVQ